MANNPNAVKLILDQIDESCDVIYKQMFGGGTIYSKGKVVALICDDKLFVKPTEAGRSFIGKVKEAPAFPGAKMSFQIGKKIKDRKWLSQLIRLTEAELPKVKAKKTKTKAKTKAKTKK